MRGADLAAGTKDLQLHPLDLYKHAAEKEKMMDGQSNEAMERD